ncbi:hypothetical protein MMC07_004855 [Pseudocyphellaria aurata]|nr:hypothetical protein [Pseudocyphellaria aurata]
MSSQKIPRSPNMSLSPDPEQSFFRILAFRSPDQLNRVNPSEASSPISPMSIVTTRKRPPLRAYSETLHFVPNAIKNQYVVPASTNGFFEDVLEEPPTPVNITKPSSAEHSNSNDSRSSSISTRARDFLRRSWSRSFSFTAMDTEPQQEAKIGRSSKRELSRHWLEVQDLRKRRSGGQSRRNSDDIPFDVPYETPIHNSSRAIGVTPKSNPVLSETLYRHDRPALLASRQISGFYYRAKRRLGLNQESREAAHEDHQTGSYTEEVLERVNNVLRELCDKAMISPGSTTSGSNKSSRSNMSWPMHPVRLKTFYYSMRNSTSSSIRKAKMGVVPQPSPTSQPMYKGSDTKHYFTVEISSPDGPSYLPSEARRINTPPLPKGEQLRGFFFDYNAPCDTVLAPSPESAETHSPTSRERRKQHNSGIDWYKVKLEADEARDEQQTFDFNVPEHLLNSPLCPRNSKHPSGGKGVCVYHGRNKSVPREQ